MPAHTKSPQSAELFVVEILHGFIRAPNKTKSEWKAQNTAAAFPALSPGLWRKQGVANGDVLVLSILSYGASQQPGTSAVPCV